MSRTVLFYTDSSVYGGAEQVTLDLIQGLDRREWKPVLVYHPAAGMEEFIRQLGDLGVLLLATPPLPLGLAGLLQIPKFFQILREVRPAVFHANLSWPLACKWGLLAAILAQVPVIIATEHLFVETPYSHFSVFQQRIISRGVDCYIAVSGQLAQKLNQTFGLPTAKIRVIHNQPRAAALLPALPDVEVENVITPNLHPVILTVSRLVDQKGLTYLIKAAALLPEIQFILVGDGPDRELLEMEAKETGVANRVRFVGYQSNVTPWIQACDIFVLPSLYEGYPLSILEAMAVGKPVIATDIPGTNEIIIHLQNGLLVPPARPEELARAIKDLLGNPDLSNRIAAAGRDQIRGECRNNPYARQVTDLYSEFMTSR